MTSQICPICGDGTLAKEVRSEPFVYKGNTKVISNYVTYRCNKCGEAIVDKATLKESGLILKDFQRKTDGLLTAEEIKSIRKKLSLTQEKMAEILGGGIKSFARYETGQVCQSRGMDNLLRILDAYPITLRVIQKSEEKKPIMQKQLISLDIYKASKKYTSKAQEGYFTHEKEVEYGA